MWYGSTIISTCEFLMYAQKSKWRAIAEQILRGRVSEFVVPLTGLRLASNVSHDEECGIRTFLCISLFHHHCYRVQHFFVVVALMP
jgi:hypothetical protein